MCSRVCVSAPLLGQLSELLFVERQAGTFVVKAADLALELAHRPVAAQAFHLVEDAFGFISDNNEFGDMAEGKLGNNDFSSQCRRFERCRHNSGVADTRIHGVKKALRRFGRQCLPNLRINLIETSVSTQFSFVAARNTESSQFLPTALPVALHRSSARSLPCCSYSAM